MNQDLALDLIWIFEIRLVFDWGIYTDEWSGKFISNDGFNIDALI